ncbi:hypothetical protein I553_5631 [Mycobacterium xenopi 4042]|uniref:Uncharacterized protein n=1 Tax=Mycobacterium xenopi 4042 TaxID=1299334 RepID=X7ZXN7_MYCXE|nr:hypothetical protein I553_5631 [Mycobacterium xenopi 4042]
MMSTTEVTETASAEPTFEELAKRVDDAIAATQELDSSSRAVAEELKAAIEAIHRAGLVTIVRRLRADEATRGVLFELVDDPVVRLLFSLHEIVRPDPTTQATRVLQSVRRRCRATAATSPWCASRMAQPSCACRVPATAARCRR